jgi:hypothetical protein
LERACAALHLQPERKLDQDGTKRKNQVEVTFLTLLIFGKVGKDLPTYK